MSKPNQESSYVARIPKKTLTNQSLLQQQQIADRETKRILAKIATIFIKCLGEKHNTKRIIPICRKLLNTPKGHIKKI